MRKFLLLTAMCLFGLFAVNAQETILVGDGADESTWASAYNTPIDVYNSYYMSQQIYTAEEITSADTLTWSVDKPDIATVDENGLVTAHSAGKVKVTATSGSGKKATCTITVTK